MHKPILIIIAIIISNTAIAQTYWGDLNQGTYKSNCYPNEKIYIQMDSGRQWWVFYMQWQRGLFKKEFALIHNQQSPSPCAEKIFEDNKQPNILRLKSAPNKILIEIINENTFKTSDGCKWNFFSTELPSFSQR